MKLNAQYSCPIFLTFGQIIIWLELNHSPYFFLKLAILVQRERGKCANHFLFQCKYWICTFYINTNPVQYTKDARRIWTTVFCATWALVPLAQEREKSFSGNLSGILTSSVFNSVGTLVALQFCLTERFASGNRPDLIKIKVSRHVVCKDLLFFSPIVV